MNDNIFLLLGTNLGDRAQNLMRARESLGVISQISQVSSIFSTAAWGKTDQPSFYNQVIKISTLLQPEELLHRILAIEQEIGRVRQEKWGPRMIDIDILFYGHRIINSPGLTIPHAGIPLRRFTLLPLNEIAADFVHPVLKKNISTLLTECTDILSVEKI